MENYKLAMNQNKQLKVVVLLLKEYLIEKARIEKIDSLEKEYENMIEEYEENGYEIIVFNEYEEKINENTSVVAKEPLLTEEQKEKINNCDYCKVVPSKKLYIEDNIGEPQPEPIENYIDTLRIYALEKINKDFENSMADIKSKYPQLEMLSWDNQEREARAYIADNTVDTPILDNIADIRGLTKEELAYRIIEKANAYKNLVGQAIGKRQLLEDMIENASSIDELEQIKW